MNDDQCVNCGQMGHNSSKCTMLGVYLTTTDIFEPKSTKKPKVVDLSCFGEPIKFRDKDGDWRLFVWVADYGLELYYDGDTTIGNFELAGIEAHWATQYDIVKLKVSKCKFYPMPDVVDLELLGGCYFHPNLGGGMCAIMYNKLTKLPDLEICLCDRGLGFKFDGGFGLLSQANLLLTV